MPDQTPSSSLDELLQPIAPDAPAGTSLRYEGTWDKVRAARRADDPSLPQGEWQTTLKKADFGAVATICADALAHRSKDLQLAVWLVEAWTQLHGIAGAALGLRLVAGLCDHFWDVMLPPLEGDEPAEARDALVKWMDDTVAVRLRLLPLSDPATGTPFSLADWETARDRSARADQGDGDARGPTWEAILGQTSLTGRARWRDLHAAVGDALRAADEAELALAAKIEKPPVFFHLKKVLRSIAGVAEQALRALGESPHEEEAASASDAPHEEEHAAYVSSGIRSRAEAYLRLTEAADYLLRTEPHSPVPYLIRRAVSWGNMSLAELLNEFIDRADDLVAIQVLLGMRKKE
jgi:type VI secretion system protein ImpA